MISDVKYIGLDVHKESISIAVMNSAGKLVAESIIETKAATILQSMGWTTRDSACDFRRRNLGCLVV